MNDNLIIKTLRIRPFSYLMLAEFFSQFSMNLFIFALLLVVFGVSNSSVAVSGVVLAFTLPSIFFGILAGVLVDRWDKKNVLLWTNILRAIIVFPLLVLYKDLVIVYLLTFTVSLVTQFFIPAETPMIPLLVDKKLLLSANALFGMGIYASIFLAYASSGAILYLVGRANIFLLLTVIFLLAAFFTSLIKYSNGKNEKMEIDVKSLSFRQEIKDVIDIISKTKSLYHALFSLTLAQILILVIAVIGPGYAKQVLSINIESFPLLFVTPAIIGLALGAVIIGSYFHKVSKSLLTKFGMFLLGIAIVLLPYGSKVESREIIQDINLFLPQLFRINVLHIMVFLAFVLGFATAFVFVPANTILQEETTDELRGKMYGVLNSLVGVLSILPVILVGGLADIFGVKSVITFVGLVVLVLAFIRTFVTDRE